MDDREFSSPVCYLDYDQHEIPAVTPAKPAFCTTCRAFIASLHTSPNENETNLEALANGKKLKFILNKDGWVYKTTKNIAETAAEGCPLCVVIFQGLSPDDRDKLMAWEELNSLVLKDGHVVEFRGEIRGGGIGFRLVLPEGVNSSVDAEGQFSYS
jgi:hypothetical protein